MKINDIKLDKVVGFSSKIPQNNRKEFVLVGRSNVGKSSFINAISGRKNFAHTSSTPGKTRTINYYLCNDKFYIVDLPGYGYAKASEKEQNDWATFINKYLETSKSIEEIVMLIDIRHTPSDKDIQMFEWILRITGYEPIVIATKLDKIKKSEINKNVQIIKDNLIASNECTVIPFSADTKEGTNQFLNVISNLI